MSIDIAKSIKELLYIRDCVIIPNLGGIVASYQSASIDHVKGQILPPSKKLVFNENLVLNDGVLVDYVSNKSNLSQDQAEHAISGFVSMIKDKMAQKEIYFIPEIGRLYKDYEGNLNFLQDSTNFNSDTFGLPTLMFYPVLRAKKQVLKIDRNPYAGTAVKPKRKLRLAALPRLAAAGVPVLFVALLLLSVYAIYRVQSNKATEEITARKVPVETRINQKPSVEHLSLVDKVAGENDQETLPDKNTDITSAEISDEPESIVAPAKQKEMIIIIGAFSKKAGVEKRLKEIYELGYNAYQDKKGNLTRVGVQFSYQNDSEIGPMMDIMRKEFDERAWVLEQ